LSTVETPKWVIFLEGLLAAWSPSGSPEGKHRREGRDGRNLNKDGLEPDQKVKLTEEDIKNKKDPQLDKALEMVVGK
jgi:hypothetical protein